MFTGIIEETGRVDRIDFKGNNLLLRIIASLISADMKTGDSININGACQTVIELKDNYFTVEAVEETLKRTTLGRLKAGDSVNLERALHPTDRLGGHLVSGHVDFVGRIESITRTDQSLVFEFEFPKEYRAHFVEKGSVAVDGISLTIVEVKPDSFTVSIIPFTIQSTILGEREVGDLVNIETDMIGKYVEKILTTKKEKSKITEEWLKKKGW
jgi:riboflavin synthase